MVKEIKTLDKAIDYIIFDDELKIKAKHILNVPNFSTTVTKIEVPPSFDMKPYHPIEYLKRPEICQDVEINISGEIKSKKFKKLFELVNKQREISFEYKYNNLILISRGFIKEISTLNHTKNCVVIYTPSYYTVIR